MADNEILKDAELAEVVGGSGAECLGLMYRLQKEGLATFTTPLVAGNEEAAAAEFKAYLTGLKNSSGNKVFANPQVYSDGRTNDYLNGMNLSSCSGDTSSDADKVIDIIKHAMGK